MWLKENRTISRKTKKASQSWMSKSTFNLESFCCTICCQMPVSINNWSKKIAWTRFSNFQVIPVKMVYNGGSLEQTLSLWETIQGTPPIAGQFYPPQERKPHTPLRFLTLATCDLCWCMRVLRASILTFAYATITLTKFTIPISMQY